MAGTDARISAETSSARGSALRSANMTALRTLRLAGLAGLLMTAAPSAGRAFVATDFRVAASSAPIVVLARYAKGKENTQKLDVIRVIRGKVGRTLTLSKSSISTLFERSPKVGRTYLFLMSSDTEAFRDGNMCGTINTLEIVDGMVVHPEEFERVPEVKGGTILKPLPLSEVERLISIGWTE